jgi:hypothetical protein
MHYSPEHIETKIDEYEQKGGYLATKLLDNYYANSDNTIVGGGNRNSLMEKIQDLYIPLGLVSRRYSANRCNNTNDECNGCLDSHIYEELEAMVFNKKKNTDTRKNKDPSEMSKTRKIRPTKHLKNT